MNKNFTVNLVVPNRRKHQLWRIMRITTLILIAAIMQVSAASYAQKISLSEKKAPLAKIFIEISQQSGYDFMVTGSTLKDTKPVTIDIKNMEISEVLKTVFQDQPVTYTLNDKIVMVSRKELTLVDKVKDFFAVPVDVHGRVTDSTGTPLVGANIWVKSNRTGIVTDSNGEFNITNVEVGAILEVSYISYTSQEVTITRENAANISITLKVAIGKLNEVSVVSTGYQTIPKERATGSFAQPIKAEFDDRVAPDVLSKLNGITSGLVFNANTTASKSGLDINIRGRSTIFANDQPLIVVDNFPYNGNINNINPNDVESVTILKDAAAASIWGVRAGNGVIVITTKKGKLNQPLRVSFNANLTVFNKPDLNYNPNQLDASSYIGLEQFLFGKGYYNSNLTNTTTGPVISPTVQLFASNKAGTLSNNDLNNQLHILRSNNVNDQLSKYFYQPATNQQYALTLSGGSDKANYLFSTGYDHDLSNVIDNSGERITINSQNTFHPIRNLELSGGLNIVQSYNKIDNTLGLIQNHLFPYSQFVDANGIPVAIPYQYNQSFIQTETTKGFLDWSFVPLNELGATDNQTKVTDIRLSTGLKYTITKGLSSEVKYQYENTNNQSRIFQGQQTYTARNLINRFSIISNGKVSGYNVPLGGILNLTNGNNISNNARATLNYEHSWKDNYLTALAGYELSQVTGDSNNSVLYGYNDELATFTNINPLTSFPTNPSGSATISSGLGINSSIARLRSTFADLAYTYKDRYTLSASARSDGSNYFGVAANQKTVPLWSAGAKWDVDKETFYQSNLVPNLSLRISYGYNGNLISSVTGITTLRYLSNASYTNLNYAQISNIGNPDLRWEKTAITNIGVDFCSKNNVITGSLEYFFKHGTDLLGFKSFPENSGITSLEGNYSSMVGHGYDLILTSRNLNGSLKWSSTFLFSHATDKVTHYDVTSLSNQLVGASGSTVPNVGKPVYAYYGYKFGGLDPSTGNPIGYLNGIESQNYAQITTNTPLNELVYIGPARPTYFGGLNNRFAYKGFAFSFQISYKLGYYFMAPTINYSQIGSAGNAFLNVNSDYNKRWQKPGDEKSTSVPSLIYPFIPARDQFYQYSTANIFNAGNIRLQDISLSYDFTKSVYHKLPFYTLQVFAYANNLGILWKANHIGIDPDAIPGPGDNSTMPQPRSLAIGIKGSF